MAVKCSHGFYYAFGCNDCTNAYNAREQATADLREREADALSVLRDLVGLHYEMYTGKDVTWVTDRMAHEDIVWARARSLVAEHTPDEERQ